MIYIKTFSLIGDLTFDRVMHALSLVKCPLHWEAKKDDIASNLESLVDTVTWILLICLSKNSTSHP